MKTFLMLMVVALLSFPGIAFASSFSDQFCSAWAVIVQTAAADRDNGIPKSTETSIANSMLAKSGALNSANLQMMEKIMTMVYNKFPNLSPNTMEERFLSNCQKMVH